MIRSMTGFGHAVRDMKDMRVSLDIKSVNHKYCEISVRIPREWLPLEIPIKKRIQERMKRGKIDVYFTWEQTEEEGQDIQIVWARADGYVQAARRLHEQYGSVPGVSIPEMMKLPDLLHFGNKTGRPDAELEHAVFDCLQEGLNELIHMREQEGANLAQDFVERLHRLEDQLGQIQSLTPESVEQYRMNMQERLKEILEGQAAVDMDRITAEAAIMAERVDVDEEVTRLLSHIRQFTGMIESEEPVGRKMDFLMQEMNREVNTIGSKANHKAITNIVVHLKAELEKIREQVQNIE